ncbi:hypothetical protein [Psychroflexus tropicus]|uniref:hypothetical protein n=1 Tax=Psychroflexus tropicus TaxID=197345 RepID=UPI0012FC8E7D|nr:hypothetical protein [Psychroflexus tropicus]
MEKESKYLKGQEIKLENNQIIVLLERWDLQESIKNRTPTFISWKAYDVKDPNKIFVIRENEIPTQE